MLKTATRFQQLVVSLKNKKNGLKFLIKKIVGKKTFDSKLCQNYEIYFKRKQETRKFTWCTSYIVCCRIDMSSEQFKRKL